MFSIKKVFPLFLVLIMMGCTTTFPLSEVGEVPINEDLLGHWKQIDAEGEAEIDLLVFKLDDKTYYAELRGVELQGTEDVLRFRIHESLVAGRSFVNALTIDHDSHEDGGPAYAVLLYELDAKEGKLYLTELNYTVGQENLESFSSSGELRAFIEAHVDDDGLYGEKLQWELMSSEDK